MTKNNTGKLHTDLVEKYPFIFRSNEEFPIPRNFSDILSDFERRYHQTFLNYPISLTFNTEILNAIKEKIYNSFYDFSATSFLTLRTYVQFDAHTHCVLGYALSENQDALEVTAFLYAKDNTFPVSFVQKYKDYLPDSKKTVGFGFGS
jgi:hypothetical protein